MSCTMKLALLSLLVACTTAQLGLINSAGQVIKSWIPDSEPADSTFRVGSVAGKAVAKHPVETVLLIGSSLCSKVKRLIGVDYEQLRGVKEPDLDQLTLNFISDGVQASFKLGSLAASLPKTPGYNHQQPLVVFMHGFIDDPSLFSFPTVNEAFQSKGHYNILALDASPLIRLLYLRSSSYVHFIGERLGETLVGMVRAGLDRKDIHLVGHSLGSHIAGFAGKTFHTLTGTLVGRISGLDPAGPCFSHVDENLRLKASDAEFVDIIHSDAGVYGLTEPVGHVDFFPNGGEQQPNCILQSCSHSRAVELFAESVRSPEAFPARACTDWEEFKRGQCSGGISLMGYGSQPGSTGLHFLRTGDKSPYGLDKEGLHFQREGVMKTFKNIKQQIENIFT